MTATDLPPDFFITGNKRPASFPLAAEPAPPVSEEPGLYEYTGNDLFLMTHGYPGITRPNTSPTATGTMTCGVSAFSGKSKNISDMLVFSLFVFYFFTIRYYSLFAILHSLFLGFQPFPGNQKILLTCC